MITQLYADKQVQTGMAVEVDGVVVEYCELPDTYGYRFFVDVSAGDISVGEACKKVMEVVGTMMSQANNKGSNWRVSRIVADESRMEMHGQYFVDVEFCIDGE